MEISFFSKEIADFISLTNKIKNDLVDRLENNYNILRGDNPPNRKTIENYGNLLEDFRRHVQIYGRLTKDVELLNKYQALNLS